MIRQKRLSSRCPHDLDHRTACDTGMVLVAEFDGLRVKLGVRVRHNLSAEREYKTFDDWRKVRVSDMLEFYDKAEEALKQDPHGRDTGQGSTD